MNCILEIPICENESVDVDEGVGRLEDSWECGSVALPEKVALPDQDELGLKVLSLDVSEDLTQRNWAQMMDCTRSRFGHDEQVPNGRCRTYYRFTLSPSPDAGCSLGSLRAYAKAWAEENFRSNGDLYEYAIVCQEDAGSLQARVIVNATNKETGRKLRIWRRGNVDLNMSTREMGKDLGLGPVELRVESFHEPVQKSAFAPAPSRKKGPQGNGRHPKAASSPRGSEIISISMRASEAEAIDAAAAAAGVTRSEYIRTRLRKSEEESAKNPFWVGNLISAFSSSVDVLERFVSANSSVQKMLASEIDSLEGSNEGDLSDLREALRESEMLEDQALDLMSELLEELDRMKANL